MNSNDVLKRTYSQLVSLSNNLPPDHPNNKMDWDIINLYNELLDKLESVGIDVEDFRIPATMLTNETTQVNYLTGETAETGDSNVKYGFFKTKLESLLTYFSLQEEKRSIGFRAPEE